MDGLYEDSDEIRDQVLKTFQQIKSEQSPLIVIKLFSMEKPLPANNIHLTVIGVNMTVNADINSSDDIKIDGKFRGNLKTTGKVIVSMTGEVTGSIYAAEIEISGKAEGDFKATKNFKIKAAAELTDNTNS